MGLGSDDRSISWLHHYRIVLTPMITPKDKVEHFTKLLAKQYQALDKFCSHDAGSQEMQFVIKTIFDAGALTMMLRVEQMIAKVELQLATLDPMTPVKIIVLQAALHELSRNISELPQTMTTGE